MKLSFFVLPWFFVACADSPSVQIDSNSTDTFSPSDSSGSVDTSPDAIDTSSGSTDASSDSTDTPPDLGIVTSSETATVPPQTVVNLGANGAPSDVNFRWSVEQPTGSVEVFKPSASSATPTFALNVAGTYIFQLELLDSQGQVVAKSSHKMVAVPVAALHVSLTWRTPNDPDETDTGVGQGSDVDLHLLRTDLGGEWFDPQYDCFWESVSPSFFAGAPADQRPSLDRDDTDGGGPENINLESLGTSAYAIGIHYWDDHGFGNVLATIRIYFNGELVEEWVDIELDNKDFWYSHVIDSNGVVTRLGDGAPSIEANVVPAGPATPR